MSGKKKCRRNVFCVIDGAKWFAAVFAVAILQMSVCADEFVKPDFPPGVPEDAVWLTESDSTTYCSLSIYEMLKEDAKNSDWKGRWSDGKLPQEGDEAKNYFVPTGLLARPSKDATQTIIPKIYLAGYTTQNSSSKYTYTFNNLFLLDGGRIQLAGGVGRIAGNITVLSEDSENPALLAFTDNTLWENEFPLGAAKFVGSKESQLRYQALDNKKGRAFLPFRSGSDWGGFEGALSIADGFGIKNCENVPITMPGSVKFGKGGILNLTEANAPCSLGNLSFVENVAVTNTGSGSTLTVTGTFDTGKNCTWLSRNTGTFGTLKLGDGLTLIDDQKTPTTVLAVTEKLVVGNSINIEYPAKSAIGDAKVLLLRLSAKAAADEDLNLSGVSVTFKDVWTYRRGSLKAEEDPENEGGRLIYAVSSPVVYYNGNEQNNKDYGSWLENKMPTQWSDGQYPNGEENVYCTTTRVYFVKSKPTTFPGKTLVCRKEQLFLNEPGYVTITNLFLSGGSIFANISDLNNDDNWRLPADLHLCGNLTLENNLVIRTWYYLDFHLESVLHGAWGVTFQSYYPVTDIGGATLYLTADNSDWTGNLETKWTKKNNDKNLQCEAGLEHHVRIVVGDAKSLGGNPAEYTYDSILLGDYAEIRFTNTTVQTASNRGLYVSDTGILNVDQGQTADLSAPVTLEGTLYKKGEGTLGFGGGVRYNKTGSLETLPETGKNVLSVKEGAIKGNSMTGIKIQFSEGTGVAADGTGASDLTGAEIVADGKICLKADVNNLPEPTQSVTYPIVKVSAEQVNTYALDSKFGIAKCPWKEQWWHGSIVKSAPDADGNVTYSVRYEKKGLVMSIR